MENVNKERRNSFISVSELGYGPLEFKFRRGRYYSLRGENDSKQSDEFQARVAYIWQSKWVGIIAIKAEGTQIDFLSDILVAVASLDLKVPILFKGDVTRNDSQQQFLAQHSITALLQHCFKWLQHCSNTATLCCAENR